jgi:hypothetical protein
MNNIICLCGVKYGVKFMLMLKNVVECKIDSTNDDEQGKKTKVDWDEAMQARAHQIYYAILIRPLFKFYGMSLVPCMHTHLKPYISFYTFFFF